MTDSQMEAILDRRVQARLASDAAYRNAENAEQQSEREMEIEQQEIDRLERERIQLHTPGFCQIREEGEFFVVYAGTMRVATCKSFGSAQAWATDYDTKHAAEMSA